MITKNVEHCGHGMVTAVSLQLLLQDIIPYITVPILMIWIIYYGDLKGKYYHLNVICRSWFLGWGLVIMSSRLVFCKQLGY